jgi:predicted small lipoprotein YifL
MTKTLMMAALLVVLAGCGEKRGATPAADTAGMAPAMSDTGMGMSHDTAMMSSDSTMARDTTSK